MELVLPNNYVVIDEEEMMYLDGGAYLSKSACQGICAALAMSPGTFIALTGAAVLIKKLINYIKVGGLGGWLIGAAAGVLALIFLIKICVDTTIKFLFIRLFDTSTLMKRRIFFLFALDVIAYLFLGYLLVIQKAGYLFSVLLLFSNFSVPFIREKEYELFKNKK
ncbi:Membrane protein [Streptococcus pneumoniae]|nr:Membrane protein [Streptococcus pneumoniae]VRV63739.1 Membrane protein [Streptococcus pneumoniae]